jgi:hypothetical protein
MIEEKKLLCAFVYSAYDSGYCGLKLDSAVRSEHKKLFREYVAGRGVYPEDEIGQTQSKVVEQIEKTGVRNYVYGGHLGVVRDRISEESGLSFEDAVRRSDFILGAALRCPVNFYKVLRMEGGGVIGKNLFLSEERKLLVMEGLERPEVGQVVSGHWGYLLEALDGFGELDKYKADLYDYIDLVKRSRRGK